jgi:hypothetical protein
MDGSSGWLSQFQRLNPLPQALSILNMYGSAPEFSVISIPANAVAPDAAQSLDFHSPLESSGGATRYGRPILERSF